MTNKEILQKTMEKYYFNAKEIKIVDSYDILRVDVYDLGFNFPKISLPYQCIIFSHDFARAFWGEERQYFNDECSSSSYLINNEYDWGCHLMKMVLEPEPLKYLEKFL